MSTKPNVIPQAVDPASIQLNQIANGSLIIIWSPTTNISYGEVSYYIRVSYKDDNCTAVRNL